MDGWCHCLSGGWLESDNKVQLNLTGTRTELGNIPSVQFAITKGTIFPEGQGNISKLERVRFSSGKPICFSWKGERFPYLRFHFKMGIHFHV